MSPAGLSSGALATVVPAVATSGGVVACELHAAEAAIIAAIAVAFVRLRAVLVIGRLSTTRNCTQPLPPALWGR